MATGKFYLLSAALLVLVSAANANVINIHLGAAAVNIGPNSSDFDTLTSPGIDLSLELLPGVQESLAFYDLNFTPACSAPVCNGIFVRGLSFGFVNAQDMTVPGSGSGVYVQPVRDAIHASSSPSSHVLSLFPAAGVVIDLSNGERLSITVPSLTFNSHQNGNSVISLGVGGSLLLTAPTAAVPEASAFHLILAAFGLLVLAHRRLHRVALASGAQHAEWFFTGTNGTSLHRNLGGTTRWSRFAHRCIWQIRSQRRGSHWTF